MYYVYISLFYGRNFADTVDGRKNFTILILKDKLGRKELTKELKTYTRTYTYIDAIKNVDQATKRLEVSFPIMRFGEFVFLNIKSTEGGIIF